MRSLTTIAQALLAAALLACAGASAGAAEDAAKDAAKDQGWRDLAHLKARALGQISQARGKVQAAAYPQATDVSVFITVNVKAFVLEKVAVAIDNHAPTRVGYSEAEATALRGDNLHRVLRTNVRPGAHRLYLRFEGRLRISDPDDPPLTGAITIDFVKGEKAQALILPVAPAALRPARRLDPKPWQWQQEAEDPRLGLVRYLRTTGRTFGAMLELLDMANAMTPEEMPAEYFVLLAHAYVDFGMRAQARQALEEYTRRGADRAPYEAVRLRLAELAFERGQLAEARRLLAAINKEYLTPPQLVDWQATLSKLQLAREQFDEAVATLTGDDNQLEVLTEVDDETNQTLTMRYNLAVAMLHSDAVDRGRTLMDRLGRRRCFSDLERALRDLANVTLGFHFLTSGQGATAKAIFHRVPLEGPYSEIALLGLGWSELAKPGSRQPRVRIGDEPEPGVYGIRNPDVGRFNREDMPERFRAGGFNEVQFEPFRMAEIMAEEAAAQKRALIALEVLARRNPLAPPVQEALVAIPYLLEKLDAYGAAQNSYQQAVATLQEVRSQINRQIDALRNGGPIPGLAGADSALAVGAQWRRRRLAGLTGVRWVQELLGSNAFNARLAQVLNLHHLRSALATRPQVPARLTRSVAHGRGGRAQPVAYLATGDIQQALAAAIAEQHAALRELAIGRLEHQREQVNEFLRAAYTGVARMYLRPQLASQQQVAAGEAAATATKSPAVKAVPVD